QPGTLRECVYPVPDRRGCGVLLHRQADEPAEETVCDGRSRKGRRGAEAVGRGESAHPDPRSPEGARLTGPGLVPARGRGATGTRSSPGFAVYSRPSGAGASARSMDGRDELVPQVPFPQVVQGPAAVEGF